MSGSKTSTSPGPWFRHWPMWLEWTTQMANPSSIPAEYKITNKMSLCRMCGGPVDFPDAHKACVLCLGHPHAEAALEGSDCQACEELASKILQARLPIVRTGGRLAPASPPPAAFEPRADRMQVSPSGGANEGLTSAQCPRRPTEAQEMVSFGCEDDDTISMNASDPDAWLEVPSEASCTPTWWTSSWRL